jgi:GntR family transcriptional regulator
MGRLGGSGTARGVSRTFSIRRGGALSLHDQLLEQLKHHIEERTWGPGAQLPPAQHLAGSLGINPNTVRAVYRELERTGYVVSAQGRGTFVAADSPGASDEIQRINDLLDEVALQARRAGLSADDLARQAYLRARLFTPHAAPVKMLFVECTTSDVDVHAQAISLGTGVEPDRMLTSDLDSRKPAFFEAFDVVVTTLFHIGEVQRAAGPGSRVISLMLEPSFDEVVARLIPLRRGTRIAIACTTRPKAEKFISSLLARGLDHLTFSAVGIDKPGALEHAFRRADQVWVSRAVREQWKGPWPGDKPVFDYVQIIDSTSLRLLRRVVAELDRARGTAGKVTGDGGTEAAAR